MAVPAALANGKASVPLPIPCDTALLDGQLLAQWWVIGTQYTHCIPTLAISNTLFATVGT